MHVLIGEDNLINSQVARKMASRLGHTTVATFDGTEVLDVLRSAKRFDVLLLDLHMPHMDGFGVLERIPSVLPPDQPRPRIIILTADALVESRDRCRALGADAFLTKPLRMDSLERALAGESVGFVDAIPKDLVDIEHFDSMLAALGVETLQGVFKEYKVEMAHQLVELKASWDQRDTDTFTHLVHAMRGTSNTFGLVGVHHVLYPLEKRANDGELDYSFDGWFCEVREAYRNGAERLEKRFGSESAA